MRYDCIHCTEKVFVYSVLNLFVAKKINKIKKLTGQQHK